MKVTYSTNAWGDIYADSLSANNVNSTYYIATGRTEDAVRLISKAGFEYIEIFDGNLLKYESDIEELKKLLNAYNVKLNAVYTAGSFIYKEILDEEIYKIERVLKIAAQVGCKNLVVGGGAKRYYGIQEDDYYRLAEALDKISALAKRYGMIAGYHSHMGSLIESPEQIDKIFSLSSIAACPDTAHIYLGGGDPYQITLKYIDRIKYFHLKGISDGSFSSIDKGDVDLDRIIKLLLEHGGIELAVEADGTGCEPEKDLEKNAEFLKRYAL